MDLLKRLFGSGKPEPADRGLYFYVQPRRCKLIARIRIDPMNDLSLDESGAGYFVRKDVRVSGCPFPAELRVQFDSSRRVVEALCEGGELVTQEAYAAAQTSSNPSSR